MWLNTPRLLRGWRRLRAGRSMDILERAVEERTLHPEEVREVPPAFFLEGALERITSVSPWRIPAVEEALVKGGSLPVRATRSWTLPEVTIVGPRIYSGPSYDHIGFGPERLVLRNPGPWRELDEAHLVSTWPGCNFFGCLLLDDFPIELLPPPSQPSVSMVTRPYAHHEGYREILGLEPPLHVDRGRFRRLTLYDEPPNNRAKAERYRRLRARLRASISGAGTNGGLIYLKRGATGDPRILANEAEVEDCLVRMGFQTVEPALLGARDVALRTLDARVVVSVEGSHLSHILYTLADDGVLVVLQPPDRFALPYKEFTDCLGMRFAFLVGHPADGGFSIPPADLPAILDRVE